MHNDMCLFEGDVQLGRVSGGVVNVAGPLAQQWATGDAAPHRRLSVVNGFNAFLWPNAVVRECIPAPAPQSAARVFC